MADLASPPSFPSHRAPGMPVVLAATHSLTRSDGTLACFEVYAHPYLPSEDPRYQAALDPSARRKYFPNCIETARHVRAGDEESDFVPDRYSKSLGHRKVSSAAAPFLQYRWVPLSMVQWLIQRNLNKWQATHPRSSPDENWVSVCWRLVMNFCEAYGLALPKSRLDRLEESLKAGTELPLPWGWVEGLGMEWQAVAMDYLAAASGYDVYRARIRNAEVLEKLVYNRRFDPLKHLTADHGCRPRWPKVIRMALEDLFRHPEAGEDGRLHRKSVYSSSEDDSGDEGDVEMVSSGDEESDGDVDMAEDSDECQDPGFPRSDYRRYLRPHGPRTRHGAIAAAKAIAVRKTRDAGVERARNIRNGGFRVSPAPPEDEAVAAAEWSESSESESGDE
jgi:hypothetical protein